MSKSSRSHYFVFIIIISFLFLYTYIFFASHSNLGSLTGSQMIGLFIALIIFKPVV